MAVRYNAWKLSFKTIEGNLFTGKEDSTNVLFGDTCIVHLREVASPAIDRCRHSRHLVVTWMPGHINAVLTPREKFKREAATSLLRRF
jgi:hypothetical protein